jgi:hypothetical protein
MTRVAVLIDIAADGERRACCCFDASAGRDRRQKRDRRIPERCGGWQKGWNPGQPAEVRAYCFRSFADRRGNQEREVTGGSNAPFHAHGTIDGRPVHGCDVSGVPPLPDREEILIRVSEADGSSVRWVHVEL